MKGRKCSLFLSLLGVGTLITPLGTYVGGWLEGARSGNGSVNYADGSSYSGGFQYGLEHGQGTYLTSGGRAGYSGQYWHGVRQGLGTESFENGERYAGQYLAGSAHGRGTSYYANGKVKYDGEWAAGTPHGNGTLYSSDGRSAVAGVFRYGQLAEEQARVGHGARPRYMDEPSEAKAVGATGWGSLSGISYGAAVPVARATTTSTARPRSKWKRPTVVEKDFEQKNFLARLGSALHSLWPFSFANGNND